MVFVETMYIVYRCKDYDGNTVYNAKSIVGIYDNYTDARIDLVKKLDKLKYKYDIMIDHDDYCFIMVQERNGKEINGAIPCFEIFERKLEPNQISF
jgi:hypothetical protein